MTLNVNVIECTWDYKHQIHLVTNDWILGYQIDVTSCIKNIWVFRCSFKNAKKWLDQPFFNLTLNRRRAISQRRIASTGRIMTRWDRMALCVWWVLPSWWLGRIRRLSHGMWGIKYLVLRWTILWLSFGIKLRTFLLILRHRRDIISTTRGCHRSSVTMTRIVRGSPTIWDFPPVLFLFLLLPSGGARWRERWQVGRHHSSAVQPWSKWGLWGCLSVSLVRRQLFVILFMPLVTIIHIIFMGILLVTSRGLLKRYMLNLKVLREIFKP